MKRISIIGALMVGVLCTADVTAYTYTFINKAGRDVEVNWKQVWGSGQALMVPKGQRAAREVGGIEIGTCMSMGSDTLRVRALPDGKAVYPLIISRNGAAYKELVQTGRIKSPDFGTTYCKFFDGMADAAHKCNPSIMLCFNLEFEIYETQDGYIVFAYK
jgi:hypothetical protein